MGPPESSLKPGYRPPAEINSPHQPTTVTAILLREVLAIYYIYTVCLPHLLAGRFYSTTTLISREESSVPPWRPDCGLKPAKNSSRCETVVSAGTVWYVIRAHRDGEGHTNHSFITSCLVFLGFLLVYVAVLSDRRQSLHTSFRS